MDLIKTGIGLSRTFKNVSRSREIVAVFNKNGFGRILFKAGITQVMPLGQSDDQVDESDRSDEWWKNFAQRLRLSFEELGPSFIKLGQLLSTREDLLHPHVISELKLLQNKVKGIPFEVAKAQIEEELKKPIPEVFKYINETPIGTASIGVVYKGELLTGETVVIKVRRPNIEKIIRTDFEILSFIIANLEKVSLEVKYLGLSKMIQDFFKATMNELNFMIEAQNCERLTRNLKALDQENTFVIPKIYRQHSTQNLLVMEFLDGKPFNEFKSLEELGPAMVAKLEDSVKLFIHTLLADGFFHADLHGGNFFILKNNQIGLIDFGLMGTLSKKNRANLVAILYAVVTQDFENLVFEFLEVADYDEVPDYEELIRDLKDSVSPYIGLSVQETNMSELVRELISTLGKHRVYLPREWFIIFRALMTLDGVGKAVGLDMNIFKILEKDIHDLIGSVLSKESAKEELMWAGKDMVTTLRMLPKHIKWFTKELSRSQYAFELKIRDADKHVKSVSRSLYFLGLSLLSSVFIMAGVMLIKKHDSYTLENISPITWVFWGIAAIILFRSLVLRKY